MKADTTITINPAQVRAWEGEAHQLESRAAAMMEEAKALRRKAEAAAFLLGIDNNPNPQASKPKPTPQAEAAPQPATEAPTMMDAIAELANASEKPIPKSELRDSLRILGYAEARLGNYFYTCIARLKGKRITVMPNGDVWKAPKLDDRR
jgi:hypothetical protein